MLAEERFREILKIVNEKKTVTVTELTELLDTSVYDQKRPDTAS